MDSFFGHREISPEKFFALCFGQGGAVLIHPFTVQTPKTAIARGPITGGTYVGLSTLRPTLAKLDNGDPTVVRSPVPGVFFYEGAVRVCDARCSVSLITGPPHASFKECDFA